MTDNKYKKRLLRRIQSHFISIFVYKYDSVCYVYKINLIKCTRCIRYNWSMKFEDIRRFHDNTCFHVNPEKNNVTHEHDNIWVFNNNIVFSLK